MLVCLPVEAGQPKPESLLLNEIGLLGAIAFVEAVLTIAVSVAFLKENDIFRFKAPANKDVSAFSYTSNSV